MSTIRPQPISLPHKDVGDQQPLESEIYVQHKENTNACTVQG